MVADVVVYIILGDVCHHPQSGVEVEDQCVLAHSLLELVRLDRAPDSAQRLRLDLGQFIVGGGPAPLFHELPGLLADCHSEEGGQMPPIVAVDGLRDARVGCTQVEALEQAIHLVDRADAHTGLADLAEDV